MRNKILAVLLIVLGLVLIVCLDGLLKKDSKQKEKEKDGKVKYVFDEVPREENYSNTVIFEDDAVTVFDDRVVNHFSYDIEGVERIGAISKALADKYNKQVIVVPLPGRFLLEDGFENQKQNYDGFMKKLGEKVPGNITLVDGREKYNLHKGEVIFFRTEDSITPLGGAYLANEIVETLGGNPLDEKKYVFQSCTHYHGNIYYDVMRLHADNKLLIDEMEDIEYDDVITCMYNGENLSESICEDNDVVYDRPVMITSITGGDTIVGAGFLYARIEGAGMVYPDEDIVLVCDIAGKNLAPYLAYCYRTVTVVPVTEDEGMTKAINEFGWDSGCSSIIWVQKAETMGNRSYTHSLNFLVDR